MSLYKSAVNKPVTTALVFLAIAFFGGFSYSRLATNLYPDFDTNTLMVMTSYIGASAEDIETNVSRPMENTLNSVSDLKHITSRSSENISVVTLEFEYGTDIDVATNDVRDKLGMLTTLPDGAESPIIFKFGADDIPILILSVTAEESTPGLYKVLDDLVTTPVARIKGVGAVSVSGIAKRQIQVLCDPLKLEGYGLTIEGISSIISNENKNVPAGNIEIGSDSYSLRVQQEFEDATELRYLIVGTNNGAPVYLKDVATIEDTQEERTQEAYVGGQRGGTIMIQKQSGANSVDISDRLLKALPTIQSSLPADVQLGVVGHSSVHINNPLTFLSCTLACSISVR